MRTLRASEIGTYLYCARAWWYKIQGISPENSLEMASGAGFHERHGSRVLSSKILRAAGWILLLSAVILIAVALTMEWVD